MAFDYATLDEVKRYIDGLGTADDELLDDVIPAVSRAVEVWCDQIFYQQTYTAQILSGQIDLDGVLLCWPAVPTMSAPTAASYRVYPSTTWNDLSVASDDLDLTVEPFGCTLRFLSLSFEAYRGRRIQVKATYIGGYATRSALPADFAWAVRQACAAEYKARETAGGVVVSAPGFGSTVITPQDWPSPVLRALARYQRPIP